MAENDLSIRSSAAEYLTYIASTGNTDESIEIRYEDENICMEGAFFVDRADRRRSHDRVDHLHTTGKECIL